MREEKDQIIDWLTQHVPVVEQILWLEVSVNDSLLMHVGHR